MTPARARRVLREDHLGASTFVEKAWHMIAIGNFADAESVLIQALSLAPSDSRGRSLLGWARMRQGRLDEAERVLIALLSENTLHAMARVNLGYVCLKKGQLDRAAELLVGSSRQSGDPKAALYAIFYRGLLHVVEKDFNEAEYCFRKSIVLAPNFIEGYYELGRAQVSSGKSDEARATWKDGNLANRFNVWGKRCGDAIRMLDRGAIAPSFS
ncbi:MAG TPA: tetratricopeptide repeat protein [Gemmatimonadaceae bacterium]|nr:tetratricopeptide repeat protein [Gemmatimonadaceae bacterium]